jgi:hypothetical protein
MSGYLRALVNRSLDVPRATMAPPAPRRWAPVVVADPFEAGVLEARGDGGRVASTSPSANASGVVQPDPAVETDDLGQQMLPSWLTGQRARSVPGAGPSSAGEPSPPSDAPRDPVPDRLGLPADVKAIAEPLYGILPEPAGRPLRPGLDEQVADTVDGVAGLALSLPAPGGPATGTDREPVLTADPASTPRAPGQISWEPARARGAKGDREVTALPVPADPRSLSRRVVDAAQARADLGDRARKSAPAAPDEHRAEVVIGRITVVVESPRPGEPDQGSTRPRVRPAAARPSEPLTALTHRFGIGQL